MKTLLLPFFAFLFQQPCPGKIHQEDTQVVDLYKIGVYVVTNAHGRRFFNRSEGWTMDIKKATKWDDSCSAKIEVNHYLDTAKK